MLKLNPLFQVALVGLAMCSATQVVAAPAFGTLYAPVAPVSAAQAQVVVYRPASSKTEPGATNVYVDREFHAALLPGGYTTACVAAGVHDLSAALNDAPRYKAKTADGNRFTLGGGNTYFLHVGEDADKAPRFIKREDAERELAGTHQQTLALSRASSVQACDYSMSGASVSQ